MSAQSEVNLRVVSVSESRAVFATYGRNGVVEDLQPVRGSEQAHLTLSTAAGETVRVQLESYADLAKLFGQAKR